MTYTTIQGDMWDSIAYKTLGDTDHTDRLILANTEHIGTYIFPSGIVLNIPEITENPSNSLPPWKRVSG